MEYKPLFTINDNIINLLAQVSELVGQVSVLHKDSISPRLRRENRIKTIHSSLAIEHNSLSLEQVTAVLNGKRILGAPQEIKEVQNAYEAYELMLSLNPLNIEDLLKAHRLMMHELVKENGRFRSGGVGVFEGEKLIHAAPPANYVPQLIADLFEWYKQSTLHILIKSCVFHYEFEFIHPFADGNGRMGRMWHTLLLSQWNELFAWLPIEELIKERQQKYYDALAVADRKADCTGFVEMMMNIILDALNKLGKSDQDTDQVSDQVRALLECMGDDELSAAQLMERLGLSHRPTFRKNYLRPALDKGLIEMTVPDKPNSRNQKYRIKNRAL
ncbi:MAG: Fic family protein [Candidatus Ornithomonoglobus sp.]